MSRYPMKLGDRDKIPETEKFVLNVPSTAPADQVKVVVTLTGDKITQADINLKLPRPSAGKDFYHNTSVRPEAPWGLQQVQDSANHLTAASVDLEAAISANATGKKFRTAGEVLCFLDRFTASVHRSRTALVNPRKRTLDDLKSSKHAVSRILHLDSNYTIKNSVFRFNS